MAKNFRYAGETLPVTPTADTATGALVLIGTVAGVALDNIKANQTGVAKVTGVFELEAVAAATGNVGADAYATPAGKVTGASSGNTRIGKFWAPLLAAETTALVKLNA